MSFSRYPKYKDSGVEWLGEVPEHWKVIKSRRLFRQRNERARLDDVQLTASQKLGIVTQSEFMDAEGRAVVRVIHGADILKHVEPNDFVISMRSFEGGIEWSGVSGSISSAYVMLIPGAAVDPSYFRHVLKCKPYIQALQSTSNLVRDGQAMRFENFTQVDLPLPAPSEQRAVALLVDHETAKIDELIQEQQRLIELLKEKRQAVISHAVTKGLDPTVPMKESGSFWLGRVPSRWRCSNLGAVCQSISTGPFGTALKSAEYVDGAVPVINPSHIVNAAIVPEQKITVSIETRDRLSRWKLATDDVVMARRGELGRAAVVHKEQAGWICGTGSLRVRPNPQQISSQLLVLMLGSLYANAYFENACVGATMPNVNEQIVRALPIVAPPDRYEQDRLVDTLDHNLQELALVADECARAITLLQERRAALISAAVTGKIDVRNYTPQPTASAQELYAPA